MNITRSWKRTVAPNVEPVDLAEAKLHLRVDATADDMLIENLIRAAREYVEDATGRALIDQTWQLDLDGWPSVGYIELPRPPLSSVSSVKYTDSAGVEHTFSAEHYGVDVGSEPGRVVLGYGKTWPSVTLWPISPIKITYVAGYGAMASTVPACLRQAVLLLVGHWYENREGVVIGQGFAQLTTPFAISSLINLSKVNYWR